MRCKIFFAEKFSITNTREGKLMIKVASLFSQLLHHFPRTEFAQLAAKHQAERGAKGFTCWTQMVAMLSVTWPTLILSGRSAEDSLAVKVNCVIQVSVKLQTNQLSRTPTRTALQSYLRIYSGPCWTDSVPLEALVIENENSASKTSCFLWTRLPSLCV